VVNWCFCWVFGEKRLLDVVFWWCSCGGLRGKRGQETIIKSGAKNTPTF
jgi:hypothetical protein